MKTVVLTVALVVQSTAPWIWIKERSWGIVLASAVGTPNAATKIETKMRDFMFMAMVHFT